jgi:SAM-dependent methyltransferase
MPWFEDEIFWRELYPYMFPAERFAAAAGQVEQILRLTGFAGHTILDLCCGPGRHAIGFARRGFEVTGVDRSSFLLERARERAVKAAVEVTWIAEDMRLFRRPEAFDLVCNMYSSFGYFAEDGDNHQVLRNVHESLTPDGVVILEMLGKERAARVWRNVLCSEYEDGALLVQRPQVRGDWSRIHNQWIVLKDGRYRSFEFEHSIYSGRELRDLLGANGFVDVRLFGDFAGAPYDSESTRLIAIARKGSAS